MIAKYKSNDVNTDRRRKWMAGAAAMVLIVGALFVWWKAVQTDDQMRADLLQQAHLIAQTVNIERVKHLAGDESDLGNASYLRLKRQLSDVHSANPQCRFLYLLGRKADGTIFFYLDSEPADSEDYSPPGQIYEEVSESLRQVFARHSATTEGPLTDRWGTWVSALMPIDNPQAMMSGLGSPNEARAMVRKAADYYRENGRERLLSEINKPEGEFHKGDLYAFVYDGDMTMLAHPVHAELVGRNKLNQKDWAGGKYFRQEIKEIAHTKGSGWVDYEYENPANKQRDAKTTYFERVDDLIICAGSYKGTGAPLAVLGMDIDARSWRHTLIIALLPSASLVLSLVVILLTGAGLAGRPIRSTGLRSHFLQHLETGLVIAAGLILTLFAGWMVREREVRNQTEAFERLAASRTKLIASTLISIRDKELESLAYFYEGSEDVSADEFLDFTAFLTKNPAVSAWKWIPVMTAAEKDRHQLLTGNSGSAFEIWQKDGDGKRVAVTQREMYYPVSQVAPLAGNEGVRGYDLGSAPFSSLALTEASQSGLATATDPISLVHEKENRKGIVVYRPVFANDGSMRLRGYVAAELRMSNFLGHVGQDDSVFLELSFLRKGNTPESLAISRDLSSPPPNTGLSMTRPVAAFGKAFALTAYAGPEFMKMYPIRASWLTLLAGLTLTGAFAFITRVTLERRQELERLVTERTLALQRSEERFKALHDASFGGIAIHDQGIVLDCNQGLSDLTGYTIEELVGMEGEQLIAPEWRDLVLPNIQRGIKDINEAEGIRKNGQKYHLSIRSQEMLYKGRMVKVMELRDITERKLEEEKNSKLEAQLQQVYKMELVGQLAGGVAHDFNNMLTVILGNANLGIMGLEHGDPSYHRFSEIRDAAERSADITQQLLAFARKQTVAPKVIDLNHALEGMLNMLRRLIGENIELVWTPGVNLWPVKVDPSQIDQILANLCVNARSAITGVGTIIVGTENSTLDEEYCAAHEGYLSGEYVKITVSDDGCGMDKSTLSHIFEPFFTTKGVGEGTGLGLSTIYGAIRQNNGFICAYSEPGYGTTFKIYLPRHTDITRPTKNQGQLQPALRGHETILLVEDELTILELTATLLGQLGYDVLSANSPHDAIRMVSEFNGNIDLLVTDVIMPEMNGRELTQRLFALQPKMKCLFMSGYTADIIASQGVLDESVFFIQKPFSQRQLSVKVREVLENEEMKA
jgi:PAS domain S-box-containing protein